MTERIALAVLVALGASCRRRAPAPTTAPAADVGYVDAAAPQDDGAIADAPAVAEDVVRLRARGGPWRALPRVDLTGVEPLGRWDDAPDRDGDELPDAMLAVHWNSVASRCIPVSATRPCPRADPADLGPDARDGAYTLAYLTRYSGDAPPGDGGAPVARVLGTRRVHRSSSTPRATLRGVEFTEFGGGVIARAELESVDGSGVTDAIDVADLFVGAGGERHAGAMIHHCRTRGPGVATRTGAVAVSEAALVPLVHRAAMAHPFAGCAADLGPWESRVAETFSEGLTVTVTHDEPLRTHRALEGLALEPLRAVDRGSSDDIIPLRANGIALHRVERLCYGDRVRWRVGEARCSAVVGRDDPPVQGCANPISALDPTQAQAVALTASPEGDATLLFTRGRGLLRTTLPRSCGRLRHLDEAAPYRGSLPPGASASPGGELVLFTRGPDLWLWVRGREWPLLVNGPASSLPRGTVRALAFLDAHTVAAVISTHLVRFTLSVSADPYEPPESLELDAAELLRAR